MMCNVQGVKEDSLTVLVILVESILAHMMKMLHWFVEGSLGNVMMEQSGCEVDLMLEKAVWSFVQTMHGAPYVIITGIILMLKWFADN